MNNEWYRFKVFLDYLSLSEWQNAKNDLCDVKFGLIALNA